MPTATNETACAATKPGLPMLPARRTRAHHLMRQRPCRMLASPRRDLPFDILDHNASQPFHLHTRSDLAAHMPRMWRSAPRSGTGRSGTASSLRAARALRV